MHISVLQTLAKRAEARRQKHLEAIGKGMEDRDYQRHVGRVAEAAAIVSDINKLIKEIRNDEYDEGDEE
jgi:hypothetical protein